MLFGFGYHDIILKPLVKLLERDFHVTQDPEQSNFLRIASKPAFLYWLTAEPNLTTEVKVMVADVVERDKWFTIGQLEETVRAQAVSRLFRNSDLPDNVSNLLRLRQPNVILRL